MSIFNFCRDPEMRSYLVILIEGPGGLPEHELELAQGAPPDASVPGLELGLPLVEEVDQVRRDGQQHRLGGDLAMQTFQSSLADKSNNKCCSNVDEVQAIPIFMKMHDIN